jgi:hypothetical protein
VKVFSFAALALLVAFPLRAQVGHDPESSPYRDLEYRQEFTPYGGWARARVDAAGVTPRSAAIAGLRHELYLAGPVSLTGDFSTMFSERTIIDPAKPRATRVVGMEKSPVYGVDLGIALGLTGRKSWHHLVPQIRSGAGVLVNGAADVLDGYKFGTPFAISFGAGLKFVAGSRLQLRADVGERLFKQKNPESFYTKASDNTAVLTDSPRSYWTNHGLLTLGASFLFDR